MTISETLTSALRTSMSVLPMLLMTMGGVASSSTAQAASSCPDGVTADDDDFDIGYGGCKTYASDEYNASFCELDGADEACPVSCETCPDDTICADGVTADDDDFDIGYGSCETYASGEYNASFCELDGADEACPVSCGTCPDGPQDDVLSADLDDDSESVLIADDSICADGVTTDSDDFDIGYGSCETYASGEYNASFCKLDGADEACPVSCGTCPDGPQDDVLSADLDDDSESSSEAVFISALESCAETWTIPTGLSFYDLLQNQSVSPATALSTGDIHVWQDTHGSTGFVFRLIMFPETRWPTESSYIQSFDTPYILQGWTATGWDTIDNGMWGDKRPTCDPSIVRVNKLTLYSGATSTAIGHFDASNPRDATFVWDQDTGSGTGGLSAWNAQAIIMEIDEILESAPQTWDTNVSLEYAGTLSWQQIWDGGY